MPRETIEIGLSEKDPYASGAQFLSVVAYPDPQDSNERERFSQAIIRWTLERRMELHSEWARDLQLIRPAYFSGSEKQHDSILKRGMKRLKHRLAAAQFIVMPHLRAIDTRRPQKVDGFVPTVDNMAILAAGYLGMKSGSQATVKSRVWKLSKPVVHAACAYVVWHQILWDKWARNPKADKQLAFLMLPEMVAEVVEIAELFRGQLADISQFKIQDNETIQFVARWVPEAVSVGIIVAGSATNGSK
jgi:hypothetical protein